jgi:hypothetical protein
MLVRSAAKPIHRELESGGKRSQMAQFRLCSFGISGGGGKPGQNFFTLTRTAIERTMAAVVSGSSKEIPFTLVGQAMQG